MDFTEKIRSLAARKAKADALPEEQRQAHQAVYNELCRRLTVYMVLMLEDAIGFSDRPYGKDKQIAGLLTAEAIATLDVERFLVEIAGLYPAEGKRQTIFEDYEGCTPFDSKSL